MPTIHQCHRQTDGQPTIAIPRFALRASRGNVMTVWFFHFDSQCNYVFMDRDVYSLVPIIHFVHCWSPLNLLFVRRSVSMHCGVYQGVLGDQRKKREVQRSRAVEAITAVSLPPPMLDESC